MPARDTQADARRNTIERDASPTRAMASRLPMLGPMHEARSMQSVVLVSSEDDWTPKPRARALPPVEEDGFLTPTPARQPLPCGADEEATTPTLAALPLPVDEADKTLGLLAPYGHPSYAEEEEWQSQPPGLYAALLASPDAPAPLPNTPPLVPGAFTRIKDVDDMRLPPPALPFLHESLSGGVEEAASAPTMYVPIPDIIFPGTKASASATGVQGMTSGRASPGQNEGGNDETAAFL